MRGIFTGLAALAAHIDQLGGDHRMPTMLALAPEVTQPIAFPEAPPMPTVAGEAPDDDDAEDHVLVHLSAPRCIVRLAEDPQVSWLDRPASTDQAVRMLCDGLHRATAWLGELDAIVIEHRDVAQPVFKYLPTEDELSDF